MLLPAVDLAEALVCCRCQRKAILRFAVELNHRRRKRIRILRLEKHHHAAVEIAGDGLRARYCTWNTHRHVFQQLGGKHDVGTAGDSQRNQTDIRVRYQSGNALYRNDAVAEGDLLLKAKLITQRDQFFSLLTSADDFGTPTSELVKLPLRLRGWRYPTRVY